MTERQEEIRENAYRLYEQRGRTHGRELDDWLEAERLIKTARKEKSKTSGPARKGSPKEART